MVGFLPRPLHNAQRHDFHSSPNIIGTVKSGKRDGRGIFTHLRLFKRPRHKWRDNIKTDLKDLYWKDVDWIHEAELPQEFVDIKYEI